MKRIPTWQERYDLEQARLTQCRERIAFALDDALAAMRRGKTAAAEARTCEEIIERMEAQRNA